MISLLDQEKLQASREQTKQATAAIKKEKALLLEREEQNQRQIQQLISTFSFKADAFDFDLPLCRSGHAVPRNHWYTSRKRASQQRPCGLV